MNVDILNEEFDAAEEIMTRELPEPVEREIVLKQLLRSVGVADLVAPNAWAVTLLKDGFRLNVGGVEVLILGARILRVNIVGAAGVAPFAAGCFVDAGYKSLPQPLCAFVGSVGQFQVLKQSIWSGHRQFIERAALTRRGTPWKGTPFRKSHCEGLMLYARALRPTQQSDSKGTETWLPQEELVLDSNLVEGARLTVQVNAFERNSVARKQCIDHYGVRCVVCDFSYEIAYGSVAKDYIHVHHLQPLATLGDAHIVDPIADLRPVCANCHSIIHRRMPPYTIDEMKAMLETQ